MDSPDDSPDKPEEPYSWFEQAMEEMRRQYRRTTRLVGIATLSIGLIGGWFIGHAPMQNQLPPTGKAKTEEVERRTHSDQFYFEVGKHTMEGVIEAEEHEHTPEGEESVHPIPGRTAAQYPPTPTPMPTQPPSG